MNSHARDKQWHTSTSAQQIIEHVAIMIIHTVVMIFENQLAQKLVQVLFKPLILLLETK